MSEPTQLKLLDLPEEPRLTERQAFILDAITRAGRGGLHHDELGALLHARKGKHDAGDRCKWCGSDGKSAAGELRSKGLVTWRRKQAAWTVAGKLPAVHEEAAAAAQDGVWQGDGPVPYGTIPFAPTPCRAQSRAAVRRAA